MWKGSEKIVVMEDVSRLLVSGRDVICIGPLGDRKTVQGATVADANLADHEITLKPL
jgi:predicted RNA-binding protein